MAADKAVFPGDSDQSLRDFQELLAQTGEVLRRDFSCRTGAFSGRTPGELKDILADDTLLPSRGLGSRETINLTAEKILPHLVNVASTDYMAHLHCATLPDSIIAELLLSVYNQSMDSWDQAPMATELELHVIKEVAALAGLSPETDGVFTSGGSQSNLMAMLLARDSYAAGRLNHDIRKLGLPDSFRKFRIYTSEAAHFSIEKSAQLMGLGFRAVRPVPVDRRKRMSTPHLERMIREDLDGGLIPIAVSATAGTTDFGSIDPLEDIRRTCDEYRLWMHVDAAYGAGLILSDRYRSRLKGMEKADSVTMDFHKMFMQPVSCSLFLLRNPSLFELLEIHADYLNREEDEEEGYTHLVGRSLATTRRFDALKVWMSFKSLGRETLSSHIESSVDMALEVYRYLEGSDDFEAVTEPEISSVVFRYLSPRGESETESLNGEIRKRLIHDRGIIIGQTRVEGKTFLKMTLMNPKITLDAIKRILNTIRSLAEAIRS